MQAMRRQAIRVVEILLLLLIQLVLIMLLTLLLCRSLCLVLAGGHVVVQKSLIRLLSKVGEAAEDSLRGIARGLVRRSVEDSPI